MTREAEELVPNQRVGAYGVLTVDHAVLLVQAKRSGLWYLPGGGVEFGETPRECLLREFREETGLHVERPTLLDVVSDVIDYPDRRLREHSVRIIYRVELANGQLAVETSGSTQAAQWHRRTALQDLPLASFVRDVLNTF